MRDSKHRRELNWLADLNYAIQKPLKMEDENWRKRFNEHLLARLAESRRTELDRLQVRDACECVFYSVNRIVLLDRLDVSHHWQDARGRNGRRGSGPGYRVGVVANPQ